MDIRYNFLNTLDHFPCELIRTLWTLQSLDISLDQIDEDGQKVIALQMENQANFLEDLVQERIKALQLQRKELVQMQEIRKRYDATRSRSLARNPPASPPLTIKLSLGEQKKSPVGKKRKIGRNHVGKLQRRDKPTHTITRRNEQRREKTYCVCDNVSYGSMIACDNKNCPTEWFHYGCVGIVRPLSGEWFCSDDCRRQATKTRRSTRRRN
ncbi:related to protein YNG1 [Zygosaccharomyces bailii]|nr:related to protein YNG1 [Zygosaccharomyces bailii]